MERIYHIQLFRSRKILGLVFAKLIIKLLNSNLETNLELLMTKDLAVPFTVT